MFGPGSRGRVQRAVSGNRRLARMWQTGHSRLLVVEDGRLAGILSVRDLLRFLALKSELEP